MSEMVRKERLELSHLAAPEPKSGASTNSATSATYSVVIPIIGKISCNGRLLRRRDNRRGIKICLSILKIVAGLPGFEPGEWLASKAAALPLGDRPAGSN